MAAKKSAKSDSGKADYLKTWNALVVSSDPAKAIRDYLAPLLTQSDACQGLLDEIMAKFKGVAVEKGELQLTFANQYKKDSTVRCSPPFDGDTKGYPESFRKLVAVHNGIFWAAGGGGYFGLGGFDYDEDDDETRFNGSGFENECLEEGDNEKFLDALERKDLSVDDVISPMNYGQNWIIWNPVKKNKVKEPQLCFVSHEDCEVAPIKKADDLYFGPFLLRVMYMNIVNYKAKVLDAVYN